LKNWQIPIFLLISYNILDPFTGFSYLTKKGVKKAKISLKIKITKGIKNSKAKLS